MTYDFICDLEEEPGMNGGNGIGPSWPFKIKERAKPEYSILPYYLVRLAFEVGEDKLANYISLNEDGRIVVKSYRDMVQRIEDMVTVAIRWTKYPEYAIWVTGISEKSKEVVDRLIKDYWGWSAYEIMDTYPREVVVKAVRRYLGEKCA